MIRHENAGTDTHLAVVLTALKRKLVDEGGHVLLVRLPVTAPLTDVDQERMLRESGFFASARARSYQTMVLDVTAEPAVLRSKLAGKWRTDLGYAERAGLSVEQGNSPVLVSRFLRVFNEMHDAKGFDVRLPPDMILSMAPEGIGSSGSDRHEEWEGRCWACRQPSG